MVRKALIKLTRKDREVRCQSGAELKADLQRLLRDSISGTAAHVTPAVVTQYSSKKWQIVAVAVVVVVVGALAVWFASHRGMQSRVSKGPASVARRLTSNLTENPVSASAISPDGKYLAYADKTGTPAQNFQLLEHSRGRQQWPSFQRSREDYQWRKL